jgi:hypothetical protein
MSASRTGVSSAAQVARWTAPERFAAEWLRRPLRAYQRPIAQAIVDSALHARGLTLAVMMPRQSGKNETAAHVEALLLNACRRVGGCLVKAAPTFQPQALISLQRLEALLRRAGGRERAGVGRLARGRAGGVRPIADGADQEEVEWKSANCSRCGARG